MPTENDEKPKEVLLKVTEVAEILRLAPVTVRRMIQRGDLKGSKLGRDWRVHSKTVHEMAEKIRESETEF